MSKFSLLKRIKQPEVAEPTLLPEGIEYVEHQIDVHDTTGVMTVHLPKSSSPQFVADLATELVVTEADVKRLLRTHRGINGT